jgi:hypothetical protein
LTLMGLGTKAKLILECEAIEQNESVKEKERKDNDHNNNNFKKNKFGNSAARAQKNECGGNSQFYCKNCSLNITHVTAKCFFYQQDLADPTLRNEKFNYERGSQQEEPPLFAQHLPQGRKYPCVQGRKKRVLGLYAAALKREQDKESKANQGGQALRN